MALRIDTTAFNFVQWVESDRILACNWAPLISCLPVYDENDVWFQFIIRGDAQEEIDALCDQDNLSVRVGIAKTCADDSTLFIEKPVRYRIGALSILYHWPHGVPGLVGLLQIGDCFRFKVEIGEQSFCSNCFQRIMDDCHTSVVEYSNTTNAFGFNYCAGTSAGDSEVDSCEPTIIQFTSVPDLTINYTTYFTEKYGTIPTVEVWIYNESAELVRAGILVKFDTYPPTQLIFDFGGVSSGIIKIM